MCFKRVWPNILIHPHTLFLRENNSNPWKSKWLQLSYKKWSYELDVFIGSHVPLVYLMLNIDHHLPLCPHYLKMKIHKFSTIKSRCLRVSLCLIPVVITPSLLEFSKSIFASWTSKVSFSNNLFYKFSCMLFSYISYMSLCSGFC